MTQARVITRALGGSGLAELAVRGDGGPFFPERPRSVDEWRARMEDVRRHTPSEWLTAVRPALGSDSAAMRRLERVAREGGVVVTTGQQPGLFGGPMYTWSKAISAVALADVLEEATGIPTAPVFWGATDDADFAEASVTYVATRAGVRQLRLPAPTRPGVTMAEMPLGDVGALLDDLATAAGSAAYDAPLAAARVAYTESETVGEAYLRLLRQLLAPLGIPVLDASHPSVAAASRPLLSLTLRNAPQLEAALRDREAALRAAGYEPQVHHVRDLTPVFEYADGTKRRIPLSRASEVAEKQNVGLGPNVLLRPIVERAILPTVAYAAGPGELAYFAQVSALASTLGAAAPLGVPRWSATIVEPYVDRILARYELSIDELRDPHAVLKRLVAQRMPGEITGSLADMRLAIHRAVDALRAALEGERPLVERRVVEGAEGQLMHRVDRLERRVLAAGKRRESAIAADIDTAHAALYPLGRPQERMLNFIPILAREGPTLLEAMRRAAAAHAAGLVRPPSGVPSASDHRAAPITT